MNNEVAKWTSPARPDIPKDGDMIDLSFVLPEVNKPIEKTGLTIGRKVVRICDSPLPKYDESIFRHAMKGHC